MKTRKAKVKAKPELEPAKEKAPAVRTVQYSRDNNRDRFHIPPELVSEIRAAGWEIVWCAEQINGAGGKEHTFKQAMSQRLANGYTICLNSDFARDGETHGPLAVYSETGGKDDPVRVDGLVLMACPREIARESEKMDKIEAAQAIAGTEKYKIHGVPGTMGRDHPSSLAFNKIERSFERIKVPD